MEYIEETTVLVVDDSEFFASLAADQLRTNHDIAAVTAADPETALEELAARDIDCIVSDYDMPEMDGLAFFERVRDIDSETPFILLTGRTDDDIASKAISAGIDDYIRKEAVTERNNFEVLANRVANVVSQQKSRQKYELIVDNTPESIAQVRQDGTIMAANKNLAEAFETTESALVGREVGDVLPAAIADKWLAHGDDALTRGTRVSFDSSHDDAHYHTLVVPVTIGGESDTYLVISRDITDRIEYQQELEETTEELELINRFVRHDIRNDINLVYMWAGALEDQVGAEETEFIDRIRSTSDHITELTNIAGEFVETVSGKGDLELEAIDLRSTLGDEVEKRRQSYDDATFQVNGQIPAVDVQANGMLSSVFRNLLNNAVQHNESDDPRVYITASARNGIAKISIADNGPGVPDDQKEAIFGKGEQGAESTGSGIGLYLVYTLVSQYGSEVYVEDSDIGGARFVVELPTVSA